MPELPEVETSRRGIQPHIEGQCLNQVIVRDRRLRWPVPEDLAEHIEGQTLVHIRRRGKYLLLDFSTGTVLIHLGMSGSVRILDSQAEILKHDHFDMVFANGSILRFNDPRRFGALLWAGRSPEKHVLLEHLGPEPLSAQFNADYCFRHSRGKSVPIKTFIMNAHIVVGVGNIYANESLFLAGIHPKRAAGKISKQRYERLVKIIKQVIANAIEVGGTTLRDFVQADGKPGYFKQQLRVYGRAGQDCVNCGTVLKEIRQNNRSTVFCPSCQH